MAVIAAIGSRAGAINYTFVTDSSADWTSVANSTYFYDKTDKLVHFKDSSGTILEIFAPAGAGLTTNYGLYAQTAVSTPIANTTVETSLIGTGVGTLTVPANAFKVGDSFTLKMCGNLSCANNEKIHVRLKSNGVTIADAGLFEMKLTTNKYFELVSDFTITKIGAAGVAELFVNGQYAYNQDANTGLDGVNFALVSNTVFDTTVINTLTVTAQWLLANPSNSIQSQNFVLNKTY
jgi:hypothetical protein